MKIYLIAAAVIAIIITVYALGSEPDSGNSITVAYFPNVGHAIPVIGIEEGIFEEHMGDVQIQTRLFDSGPQAIEALFAGSVDIAYVGPGPAINGFLNSQGNVRILSGAASGGASFVVHPDSMTDNFVFDGKRIAAPQIGNTQDVSLRYHLSEQNLQAAEKGGSVTIHNIANPDIYTLFVKGEIDGAWVAEPWATILEYELGGIRMFHEEELWSDGRFASVLLVANSDYAEENPEIIRSWLLAHNASAALINADKKEAGAVFNGFMVKTLGRGLDAQVMETALYNIEITTDPIADSVHIFAKQADELGYLGRNSYSLSGIFYDMDSEAGS